MTTYYTGVTVNSCGWQLNVAIPLCKRRR